MKNKTLAIFPILILPPLLFLALSVGGSYINPCSFFYENCELRTLIELRFFRVLTAFAVGGALALSGVAYQAVLRNPLAEPFILGISGGASVGAAIAIVTGLSVYTLFAIPLLSFVGALVILTLVLTLSRGGGAEYSKNIMLSGIIAGTLCSSVLMFMISVMDVETLHNVTWWMLGSLQAGSRFLLYIVILLSVISLILLTLFGRDADILAMGEEAAFHFGLSPRLSGLIILGTASLLTAAAVSLSGIIGFVGLVVPHILRKFCGASHRTLFPLAFFAGGGFLVLCDTFARTLFFPLEVPVGVITALLGGPFFIWMINKKYE
jgi:iron complex transport system permease protein